MEITVSEELSVAPPESVPSGGRASPRPLRAVLNLNRCQVRLRLLVNH